MRLCLGGTAARGPRPQSRDTGLITGASPVGGAADPPDIGKHHEFMSGRDRGSRSERFSVEPWHKVDTVSALLVMCAQTHNPKRKRPAHLPNIDRFNQPTIVFVTVCSKDRRPILACKRVHEVLLNVWPRATQHVVGRYVVMPDHIHLFCSPAVHEPENVRNWVGYWKRLASCELTDLMPVWQRDCWDTQLRHVRHYDEKWAYVVRNPVRKGLVTDVAEWLYQGVVNELRW